MEKKYKLQRDHGVAWVAALRSDKYKQSVNAYYNKDNDCYCALGVSLAIIGAKPSVFDASLPDNVRWPVIDDLELKIAIMDLNDGEHKTFHEIADWIEQNVQFI